MRVPRVLLAALLMVCIAIPAGAAGRQSVLIRAQKPYTSLEKAIQKLGGTVTIKYEFINGIAAEIPESAMPALEKLVGAQNIGKDELMSIPESPEELTGRTVETDGQASIGDTVPADYLTSQAYSHINSLFGTGQYGNGVIVAVIDSGYRPMFNHVSAARVLSGFSLVPGETLAVSNSNYPHGTQVAGIAAANIAFCSARSYAVEARTLGAAQTGTGPTPGNGCAADLIFIPMVGTAPLATIYPVKIFPNSGAGSPTSRTLAAMQHVLQQRKAFDAGAGGFNIKVVNMSLGGPTSFAGRTLNDEAVTALLDADIVPVISMGNNGSASVTGGSPGTAMASLTVGAASLPESEWIVRALVAPQCAASATAAALHACVTAWRPDANVQVSDFSSRGPTHDGRIKPDVIATGSYSFTQGSGASSGTVGFVSGTSFSAPEVAGVAATLRGAFPSATARQIRNAIIMTANPSLIPTATPIDQGRGYVDAAAAAAMLQAGTAPDTVDLDFGYTRNLQANLAHAGVPVYSGSVSASETDVRPAERREYAFQVPKNAGKLFVSVGNVVPGAAQNTFFGDDVYFMVQGNTVHTKDYRPLPTLTSDFIGSGDTKTYTFTAPEEGIWRITPQGDWTNKSPIAFGLSIWTTEESSPQYTAKAKIGQGDLHIYTVQVPAGTASLKVNASWLNMSANYPINDIDVTLVSPSGAANYSCATGRAPEACTIATPAAGTWTVRVEGFSVYPESPGGREVYTVRLAADGVVLK